MDTSRQRTMDIQNVKNIPDVIGASGKHNIFTIFLLSYISAIQGIFTVSIVFLAPEVNMYWDWDYLSPNRTTFKSSNCKFNNILLRNTTSSLANHSSFLVYESPYSTNTITEKFNLVCESSWLVSFSKCLGYAGNLVGCLIFSRCAERFGRKKMTLFLEVVALISNIGMLFSPNYPVFAATYFMFGCTAAVASSVCSIQMSELMTSKQRQLYGIAGRYGVIFGYTVICAVSWVWKDWFIIQVASTIAVAISIPLSCFVIESPAWLMIKGRYHEAKENLVNIAKRNGVADQDAERKAEIWIQRTKILQQEYQDSNEKGTVKDLFKNYIITKYTCSLAFVISVPLFCNQSVLQNVETFGVGLYVDFTVLNAVILVCCALTGVAILKLSIRSLQLMCLIFLSIVQALYVVTYKFQLSQQILCTLLRGVASASNSLSEVYMAEIYPTSVRVIGCGFVRTITFVFLICSPFTKELSEQTAVYIPFILFTVLCISAAIVMKIFLPETRDKELIDTVDELQKQRKLSKNISPEAIKNKF